MKTIKYWVNRLLINGAVLALFVLWKGVGIEGAGNLLLGVVYAIGLLGVLCSFTVDARSIAQLELDPPTAARKAAFWIPLYAIIGALMWYGHFGAAAAYFTGAMFMYSAKAKAFRELDEARDRAAAAGVSA